MRQLFNKSFFKLSAGFISIIFVAIIGIFLVRFFEIDAQANNTTPTANAAN